MPRFPHPLRSSRAAGAAAALVLLPALPPSAVPAPPPLVRQQPAAAQCGLTFGRPAKTDALHAAQLMSGYVDMGKYGWFRLAADPAWRPVGTLDDSGNGHMHSLDYLLPLLREGVRTGDPAMLERFYAVLHDWVRDNGPTAASRRYAWGPPIYEGFRSLVLVCAAAGPRGRELWLRQALALHGRQLADPARYSGINNTSLHQSMGLYAIASALGRADWRAVAVSRMRSLARHLVHGDGSDEEGAPGYAISDYRWFREAAERLRRGHQAVPAELDRVAAIPSFVAQLTRPDGRTEALGDTTSTRLTPSVWKGTAAEFAATDGTSGRPPTSTYQAFAGGYVVGRSGWGRTRPLVDETYYSLRAGRATGVPHAHADQAALTLYAYGSELLFDTGQWAYRYGATRSFVVSRAAHNVVLVDGLPHGGDRPTVTARRLDGVDLTTVTDTGYAGVTLVRTVAYDRAEDALVVWDRLTARRPVRAAQQWGLGRDRSTTQARDTVHTAGPGANVSLLFPSGAAALDVVTGAPSPRRGWNSLAYGELSPAPSLRATQTGTSLSWVTVLVPRGPGTGPEAATASATSTASTADVQVTTSRGTARLRLTSASAVRTLDSALPRPALVGARTVRPGSTIRLRATGLPPYAPVALQSTAATGGFAPAATGRASAAGTAWFPVRAGSYRVASGGRLSGPLTVSLAVAPAARRLPPAP